MTKALKAYSKAYRQMKAYEAVCNDLKKEVLRDLNKQPEGKAIVEGVEFHKTKRVVRTYPKIKPILDKLNKKIEQLKETAQQTGEYKVSETPTFNASIPKSATEAVLAKSCKDYKKHFRIAA